ncbi:hypothetical protein NIES4073_42870 [Kalymmatonema gypsitolerans NIES-4073]|nr:hypothetical protein NIES4073_42870 [Scytonema sp. NIES-4073]
MNAVMLSKILIKEVIIMRTGAFQLFNFYSTFVAQKIRDEIREVAPNIYLGQAYWEQTRVLCFALEF